MSRLTVDELFAGSGGWSQALRLLDVDVEHAIDNSADACATARAAGHIRTHADILRTPPTTPQPGQRRGVVGSPPCTSFTVAGWGDGLRDIIWVRDRMTRLLNGERPVRRDWNDYRSRLTAEPARWIYAVRPEFVALEQVVGVMPLWEHMAELLSGNGYSVWAGVLGADRYGVASTRRRAVLIASRVGTVDRPPPIMSDVSMRTALGVDDGRVLISNYGTGGDPKARGRRTLDQSAPTMTGRCCRNKWLWPDGSTRNMTIPEAAVLSGFPAAYPFSGSRTSQQQQLGDAVPPPLARAVLRAAMRLDARHPLTPHAARVEWAT